MVIFHSYVNVYQRVPSVIKHDDMRKVHDNPLFTSMSLESFHLVICQICDKCWRVAGITMVSTYMRCLGIVSIVGGLDVGIPYSPI